MTALRAIAIWAGHLSVIAAAIAVAAASPLLQWRDPVYILAGFAGIIGLALMVFQPLLVTGRLPGLTLSTSKKLHRFVGVSLLLAVVLHVAALWVTSPPDVVDVLLFRSPAPFSLWGAIAMWAVFLAAGIALVRKRLRVAVWRYVHSALVCLAVATTVAHTLLIDGTMGSVTKGSLCLLTLAVLGKAISDLRVWRARLRSQT